MSTTVSITGIPKTATMEQVIKHTPGFIYVLTVMETICKEVLDKFAVFLCFQILGAFTVPDGVPQPGMKIKNVPGKDCAPVDLFWGNRSQTSLDFSLFCRSHLRTCHLFFMVAFVVFAFVILDQFGTGAGWVVV